MSTVFPLSVRGALTRRRGQVLVGPIDLELAGDGITVIIGPNGSGKTSLLNMLHGTARLHEGDIRWGVPTDQARAAQAFVFQRPVMLRRSVHDNLAYPLQIWHMPRADVAQQVQYWAKKTGLMGKLALPATALSGGEQQKLALARALITRPKLLFLDEPCAALDGRATKEIEALIAEIAASGTGVILSTHDMGQARRLASQVVFLLGGRVYETGPASTLFDAPQTPQARAFLAGDIVE